MREYGNYFLAGLMAAGFWLFAFNACAKNKSPSPCPAAQQWIASYQKRMLAEVKPLAAIKPADMALARQLAKRAKADQAARSKVMMASSRPSTADIRHLMEVDKSNLAWLKQQVTAHGFPTLAQVGLEGIQQAWLLTQHADDDPVLQARVLAQLKPRLARESFMRADFAMLTDRVRVGRHEKQIYGSQFHAKGGRWVLSPVEDAAHLDIRRARMNLMPMADYRCVINASYATPPKKH